MSEPYVVLLVGGPAHGELRQVQDLSDVVVVERRGEQGVLVLRDPDLDEQQVPIRNHYYSHRELGTQDSDGRQWTYRVFLHAALLSDSSSELLRLQMVLSAMIRHLPGVVERDPNAWRP